MMTFFWCLAGLVAVQARVPRAVTEEVKRQEKILKDWRSENVSYGTPCFDGCAPGPVATPNGTWTDDMEATRGTFVMVIAWCCERLDWIFHPMHQWGNLLRRVVIVQKCLNSSKHPVDHCDPQRAAEDAGLHVVTNFSTSRRLEARILQTTNETDAEIDIETEPGRKAGASSDECGAYLRYIVEEYDTLGDGIVFMQGDGGMPHRPRFPPPGFVAFAESTGVLPMTYAPLTGNFGAGGNPTSCVNALSSPEFSPLDPPLQTHFIRPTGARNGIFYASRHVVWRRPWKWYKQLQLVLEVSMICQAAKFRPKRRLRVVPRTKHRPIIQNDAALDLDLTTADLDVQHFFDAKILQDDYFRTFLDDHNERQPGHLLCDANWGSACVAACGFLEHSWAAVVCEACSPPPLAFHDPRRGS